VESDGHHVSAVRFDGTVLWTRDLYGDVKRVLWDREHSSDLEADLDQLLRGAVQDRKITSIARADSSDPSKLHLSITFSSADFGVADGATGTFLWLGRD
jgi:hypothetical protein